MKCPKCGEMDTKVLDSRVVDNDRAIRRRRQCEHCEYRFKTYERPEQATFIVIKKDGTREPYSRDKALDGIWRSCTKRPVTVDQISNMLGKLEEKWSTEKEVPSGIIGEDIMDALKALDEIAYVRFASVYRRFKDIDEFKKELEGLL